MSLNLIPDNITRREMSKVNNAYWSEVCQSCLKAGDKGRWWWFLFASLTSDLRGEGERACVFCCFEVIYSWLYLWMLHSPEKQCLASRFHTTQGMPLGCTLEGLGCSSLCFWMYEEWRGLPANGLFGPIVDLHLMAKKAVMYFKINCSRLQVE